MSDWQRRRHRLLQAQTRLFGKDEHGMPNMEKSVGFGLAPYGVAEVLEKARHGMPLTEDEYVVANLGCLPRERGSL